MRTPFLAALLGSTALAATALAQSQPQVTPIQVPEGQAQAKAAIAECDRLIAFLDPNRPTAGITVERAQEWKRNSDAAACKSALDRLTQASTGATDAQRAQAQLNNPQTGYGTHAPSGEAAVPEPSPGPQTTGALPSDLQALPVSRIEDMDLYNAREEKLGDVEAVVTGAGGRTFLIVSHGGFLGLGEKQVIVPAEQVGLRGDRLIVDRLSDEDIRNLPAYDRNAGYRELQESQSAQIRTLR